jgi:hypothetical protein
MPVAEYGEVRNSVFGRSARWRHLNVLADIAGLGSRGIRLVRRRVCDKGNAFQLMQDGTATDTIDVTGTQNRKDRILEFTSYACQSHRLPLYPVNMLGIDARSSCLLWPNWALNRVNG